MKLGILGSTRGTSMQALLKASAQHQVPLDIALVLSDREKAPILERAKERAIPHFFIDKMGLTREAYDRQLTFQLERHAVDLVLLIGYMSILSREFFHHWRHKVMNVHPSLLPLFAKGMDSHVHQAVLSAGSTESGCSVHYVTEDIDAGPLIVQKKCMVLKEDTVETLKARVQALEGEALLEAILQHENQCAYPI